VGDELNVWREPGERAKRKGFLKKGPREKMDQFGRKRRLVQVRRRRTPITNGSIGDAGEKEPLGEGQKQHY